MQVNIDLADRLLQRAEVLFDLKRYQDAEIELRKALADNPNDARLYIWLSLVLLKQYRQEIAAGRDARPERLAEALKAAQNAIRLEPTYAFPYAAMSLALLELDRYDQALQTIRGALRLDAGYAPFYAILARVYLSKSDWPSVLAAAEQGLQLDPQDIDCINLRFLALVQLGRQSEAGDAIQTLLAREPDNAVTQANMGWLLLHRGQPQEAMRYYREAMRLDPMSQWARLGIVEAMKAHYPLYRPFLSLFLWGTRLTRAQADRLNYWSKATLRTLRIAARVFPPLLLIAAPVFALYFIFAFLAWTVDLFFDLLLRSNPMGRQALSQDQIKASDWAAVCLLVTALCLGGGVVWHSGLLMGALCAFAMLMPVASIFRARCGKRRIVLAVGAGLLTLSAALGTAGAVLNQPGLSAWLLVFFVGWFIYWAASNWIIKK